MISKVLIIILCAHQFMSSALKPEKDEEGEKNDDFNPELQDDLQFDEEEDVEFIMDDMILSKEQMDELFGTESRRNAVVDPELLWPNNTVPVFISNDFNETHKNQIMSVLKMISSKTCIQFKFLEPNFTELDYVNITSRPACSSNVGYKKGEVTMSLYTKGCMIDGKILHEFLHVLGFFHMHSTANRDEFVTIEWDNINPEAFANFKIYADELNMFNTTYDYDSVTHYSPLAYSINGKQTIISKTPNTDNLMGQRTHLSKGDIIRVNRLYQC